MKTIKKYIEKYNKEQEKIKTQHGFTSDKQLNYFKTKTASKEKSLFVYGFLLIFGGFIGAHAFYAGEIVKGILYLIMSFSVVFLIISALGCLIDLLKMHIKKDDFAIYNKKITEKIANNAKEIS